MEFPKLKNECMELRQNKEAWTKVDHSYEKTLIEYKHKVEGLEIK